MAAAAAAGARPGASMNTRPWPCLAGAARGALAHRAGQVNGEHLAERPGEHVAIQVGVHAWPPEGPNRSVLIAPGIMAGLDQQAGGRLHEPGRPADEHRGRGRRSSRGRPARAGRPRPTRTGRRAGTAGVHVAVERVAQPGCVGLARLCTGHHRGADRVDQPERGLAARPPGADHGHQRDEPLPPATSSTGPGRQDPRRTSRRSGRAARSGSRLSTSVRYGETSPSASRCTVSSTRPGRARRRSSRTARSSSRPRR